MPQRFALLGAGFWAPYQLAAWREVGDVRCVAICDPNRQRAQALGSRFGIGRVYDRPGDALRDIDFADIVAAPDAHVPLVRLCLERRIPTICQKPLAERLSDAEALAIEARDAGVPLLVHENWRWQAPIRALKETLDSGAIGDVFRARLTIVSGFPLFENQPFLATLPRFVLADMGVHVLDTARFLFGDAQSVYGSASRVQPQIAGEDVATVVTRHRGVTVITELGYPGNAYAIDRFPQTFARIEGSHGSIELGPDFALTTTSGRSGQGETRVRTVAPSVYDWVDPAYAVVQSAMVPCLRNLLSGLSGGPCETTADDNLKTLRLVEAAYESAKTGEAVTM